MAEATIIQQKCVDTAKLTNPEKKASVYDMRFQKKWMEAVSYTHLDALHVAEDVQLGEGNVGGALHPDTVAGGHQIDRAYPAGTACLGTVLVAGLPQFLGLRAEPLLSLIHIWWPDS